MSYYVLPNIIRKWIEDNLKDFHGIINIELIDDKIIDISLCFKNLNYFQNKELIEKVIGHYETKNYMALPKLKNIFIIPIYPQSNKKLTINHKDIISISRYYDYALNYLISYKLSDNKHLLIVTDLDFGCNVRDMILKKYYGTYMQRMYIYWSICDLSW